MDHHNDIFPNRCKSDPQGVIKDLLRQSTNQAATIAHLTVLSESVLEPDEANYLLDILEDSSDDMATKISKKLKNITKVKKKK